MALLALQKVAQMLLLTFVAAQTGAGCGQLGTAGTAGTIFDPAYVSGGHSDVALTLFPVSGPSRTIRVPDYSPPMFHVIGFGSTGMAIYGLADLLGRGSEGVVEISFNPPRHRIVPGSDGFRAIWRHHVAASREDFIVGVSERFSSEVCAFELDTGKGHLFALPGWTGLNCQGRTGAISPDGRRAISYSDKFLSIVNLATGAVQTIGGIKAGGSVRGLFSPNDAGWSPDGRWIVVTLDGHLILIDTNDTSRRRDLGSAGNGPITWSPDSKYLLKRKSQLRCAVALYFETLEIIDVGTRHRRVIKSSECSVTSGAFGWMSRDVAAQAP